MDEKNGHEESTVFRVGRWRSVLVRCVGKETEQGLASDTTPRKTRMPREKTRHDTLADEEPPQDRLGDRWTSLRARDGSEGVIVTVLKLTSWRIAASSRQNARVRGART